MGRAAAGAAVPRPTTTAVPSAQAAVRLRRERCVIAPLRSNGTMRPVPGERAGGAKLTLRTGVPPEGTPPRQNPGMPESASTSDLEPLLSLLSPEVAALLTAVYDLVLL